ncbi:MAG: S8 family serine peptidase [Verrucomicrobiaceae bacterium]|nr:S8 family serine peptidase [Verrucomicrobiaceae bacterium]
MKFPFSIVSKAAVTFLIVAATSPLQSATPGYHPLPEGVLRLVDGTSPGSFELALDQIWVRPSGERGFVERIPQQASNAALYNFVSARESASPGDECGMVAFPEGKPINDGNIRFVTRKVTVQLEEDSRTVEHANAIAAELGLMHGRKEISINGWTVFRLANSADTIPVAKQVQEHPRVFKAHAMLGFRVSPKLCSEGEATRFFPDDPLYYDPGIALLRLGLMNFPSVWQNADPFFGLPFLLRPYAGAGMAVAVSDDGLYWEHEDLEQNILRNSQFDFIDNDGDPSGGEHGTQVAGVIFGRGGNGIGITGVAPKAKGAGLRWDMGVTDDEFTADLIDYKAFKFDVHNASWGMPDGALVASSPGPLTLDQFERNSFGLKQLPYVFPAGNGAPDGTDIGANSNYDGFANNRHTITVTSLYGGELGANIICATAPPSPTTAIDGDEDGVAPDNYFDVDESDTSFAAGVASGLIALMTEAREHAGRERLGWRDFQEILIATSQPTGLPVSNGGIPAPIFDPPLPYVWDYSEKDGYGLIDVATAVAVAEIWPKLPSKATYYKTVRRSVRPRDEIGEELNQYLFNFNTTTNIRVEHAEVRLTWEEGAESQPATVRLVSPTFSWGSRLDYEDDVVGYHSLMSNHETGVDLPEDYTLMSVGHWGQLSAGLEDPLQLSLATQAEPRGKRGYWRVDVSNGNGRKLEKIEVILHGTVPNTPPIIDSGDLVASGDPTVLNPERILDQEDLLLTNLVIIDPEYQDPVIGYQWQQLHPDGVTWIDMPGEKGNLRGECDWIPVADFRVFPETPRQDREVKFTSESRDVGGEIVSFEWDFGDGNTSTEQSPLYSYTEESIPSLIPFGGSLFAEVTLTVTDDTGNIDSFSRFVQVLLPDEPSPDFVPELIPNPGSGTCIYDGEVTLPASSISSGAAYRVIVTPRDPAREGVPSVFPPSPEGGGGIGIGGSLVAVNSTPVTEARVGEPYAYDVNLWINNLPPTTFPAFFKVNEVSQGILGNESNGEWIELLTVVGSDMRGYHLTNSIANFDLRFTENALWSSIPVGTLILIYNGDFRDGVLPADDYDVSDGVIIANSNNPAFFTLPANGDGWGEVSNSKPAHLALWDRYCRVIDGVSWNGDQSFLGLGELPDGQSAHASSIDLAGFETAGNWVVGSAEQPPSGTPVPPEPGTEGVTPGLVNDTNNEQAIDAILADGLTSISTYSLQEPAPAWLTINPVTGLLSGTPSAADAGVVTVTVARAHSFSTETQTFDITVLGSPALPPLEDEDDDSIINMLEVAFGTDPQTASSVAEGLPVVSEFIVPLALPTKHLAISFRRMKDGNMNFGTMTYTWVSPAGDTYLYQVESSSDLLLWEAQPGSLLQENVADTVDDPENVEIATYRTVAPLGFLSTQYLRLSITINP